MNRRSGAALFLPIIAAGIVGYWIWQHNRPRGVCLEALQTLVAALNSGNTAQLLKVVVIPAAVRNRTVAEQAEFLTKALRDEISPEGLAMLKRRGRFGSLEELFPTEAEAWAGQAGVNVTNCVAFTLERNGLRAEVVLARENRVPGSEPNYECSYRIVRVNNVKQLAEEKHSTAD